MAEGDAKSDLWWPIGFLAFFALLWLVGGGPERPESRSGPFVQSPPTSTVSPDRARTGDRQIGQPPPPQQPTDSTVSRWKGQIKIQSGSARYEIQPNQEYVVLETGWSNQEPIKISGWRLTASRRGREVTFPLAVKLFVAGSDNKASEPIVLGRTERAVIVTGRIPNADPIVINANFKTNICTGYLEALPNYHFVPALRQNCPWPEKEQGVKRLDDTCYEFVRRLAPCHTPKFERREGIDYVDNAANIDSSCRQFLLNHFNYNACVSQHSADPNFFGDEWRVFLNRSELWADRLETISLYDQVGKLVDQLSY